MRRLSLRPVVGVALLASLAVAHSGAQAATPPTLDGKKVKTLTATFSPKQQDNDADIASITSSDRTECAATRCGRLPFVFKPAKGVKGNVAFTINWSVPGQDFDLYVAEIAKDGSYSQLESCGTFAGTSEKIQLPGSDFKPGKKYALVADYYRATGTDKLTATVAFPGDAHIATTVPAAAEDGSGFKVDCGLS